MTILLMILYMTLAQAGIDIYLPALPHMGEALATSKTMAQYSISLFLLSYGLSQAACGALSDIKGRRPFGISASLLFIASSLLAMSAHHISTLLIARFLQGIAAGCFNVLAKAIIRDRYEGKQLQKAVTTLTVAWGCVPLLAPILGGYLVQHVNWQSCFLVLAIGGAILFVFSCFFLVNQKRTSTTLNLQTIVDKYRFVLSTKRYLPYVCTQAVCFCCTIILLQNSTFLFQKVYGFTPLQYAYAIASIGAASIIGPLINQQLLRKFNSNQLIGSGWLMTLIFSIIIVLIEPHLKISTAHIVITFLLLRFTVTLVYPNCLHNFLALFTDHAATASSIAGLALYLTAFAASSVIAHLPVHSIYPIILSYLGASLIGLIIYQFKIRPNHQDQ